MRRLALIAVTVALTSGCGSPPPSPTGGAPPGDDPRPVAPPPASTDEAAADHPHDPVLDAPPRGEGLGVVHTALAGVAPLPFVALGGGEFTMGSAPTEHGHQPWEGPRHRVTVSGFWIATTELTVAQYNAAMVAAGEPHRAAPHSGDVDEPVLKLLWCDAVRAANALSRAEGLDPVYGGLEACTAGGHGVSWDRDAGGYRLPTEAEWEYAARAGTVAAYGTGSTIRDLEQVGWFDANAGGPTAVGRKAANPWGLHDVHGNAWEWVWDPFALYGPEPVQDPIGAGTDGRRVLRGGGFWHGSARGARAAARNALLEGRGGRDWCRDFGVRLARDAPADAGGTP